MRWSGEGRPPGARLLALALLGAAALLALPVLGGRSAVPTLADSALALKRWLSAEGASVAWPRGSPDAAGFDAEGLEAWRAALAARGTQALLLAQGGRLILEWYDAERGPDVPLPLAAAAKGVVGSSALLLALQDGRIGLDDAVSKYLPAWRDDPLRSRVTIRHLAAHASGLVDVVFRDGRNEPYDEAWKRIYETNDAARFSLAVKVAPLTFAPGSRHRYSGIGYYALAVALAASLRDAPDPDLHHLLQTRLMTPLGIPQHAWSMSYDRVYELEGLHLYACGSGANFTPRALARMGQWMAQRGRWQGQALVDARWVDEILRDPVPGPVRRRLGVEPPATALGWYLNRGRYFPSLPEDAFLAVGTGHRLLLVVPSLDLVAVRLGDPLAGEQWSPERWAQLETQVFAPLRAARSGRAAVR